MGSPLEYFKKLYWQDVFEFEPLKDYYKKQDAVKLRERALKLIQQQVLNMDADSETVFVALSVYDRIAAKGSLMEQAGEAERNSDEAALASIILARDAIGKKFAMVDLKAQNGWTDSYASIIREWIEKIKNHFGLTIIPPTFEIVEAYVSALGENDSNKVIGNYAKGIIRKAMTGAKFTRFTPLILAAAVYLTLCALVSTEQYVDDRKALLQKFRFLDSLQEDLDACIDEVMIMNTANAMSTIHGEGSDLYWEFLDKLDGALEAFK